MQWRRLQPLRLRTFKRSRDPAFAKVEVGLNLDPPTQWWCASTILRQAQEEESQIQALKRIRADRPLVPAIPPLRPTTIPITAVDLQAAINRPIAEHIRRARPSVRTNPAVVSRASEPSV